LVGFREWALNRIKKREDTRLKTWIRVIKERWAYEERLLIRERWVYEGKMERMEWIKSSSVIRKLINNWQIIVGK
jgi:hypothetical protein